MNTRCQHLEAAARMNTWRAEGHSRFKLNRPFIADLKRHDFVALVAFTED
jgi:hypothetical protein